MQGFQLTFYTEQDKRHDGRPLSAWLVEEALKLGIGGATVIAASEGFGHHRKLHAARFFELGDQPVEVTMAVTAAEADRFMARLREADVRVFYTRAPVEFGMTDEA